MAVDTRDSDALDLEETPVRRRRAGSWIKFGLVGASGILVNQLILVLLTEVVGVYYLLSAVVATLGSTTWNFVGVDGWVFADRRTGRPLAERYFAFLSVNVALLVARVPMLWLLTDVMGIHYSTSNLITLAALFVLRVVVADMWVWRERSDENGRKGATTTADATNRIATTSPESSRSSRTSSSASCVASPRLA